MDLKDKDWIYLDHNATTPCDPRVVEAMLPYFSEHFANPSSPHRLALSALDAVEEARLAVAELIGASPQEIVFTSGATESNNLAIIGLALGSLSGHRKKLVISAVEHKSVLEPCAFVQRYFGLDVHVLPVDRYGVVDLDAARDAIDDETLLVSVQLANNEVGTLQPVSSLSKLAHSVGAWLHCDAAQAVGKVPVSVHDLGVDLLSLSGHKMYGPKGVGALYISFELRSAIEGIMRGGNQEFGVRAGTLNVPAIVGLGEAARIAKALLPAERSRLQALRDSFERELVHEVGDVRINGHPELRLPNTSSITLHGVDSEALIANVTGVALSASSACTAGDIRPSHVLVAMGVPPTEAFQTIRVAVGRYTTADQIRGAVQRICEAVQYIRETSRTNQRSPW